MMSATANSHATAEPAISFGSFREAWRGYAYTVQDLIERSGAIKVCELGGGANPTLSRQTVELRKLDYTILDIARQELDKAPPGFKTIEADICDPNLCLAEQFDFAFSKMLAEHMRDGEVFHRNVFRLLRPGGIAFHFFPTLWAPPFVANLLLPERLSATLLNLFSPRDRVRHGKFPAPYSWCRGPTPRQFDRFRSIGYEIIEYRGFFGHDYYRRIPIARWAAQTLADYLERNPAPILTSFAQLCLRRPMRSGAKR